MPSEPHIDRHRECAWRYTRHPPWPPSKGPTAPAAPASVRRRDIATVSATRHLVAILIAPLVPLLSWLLLVFGVYVPNLAFTGANAIAAVAGGLVVGPLATLRLSRTGIPLMLAVSMLIAAMGPGCRRPARRQTRETARHEPDRPMPSGPRRRTASREPRGPRRPANIRSNLFGPADNSSDRWRQNR